METMTIIKRTKKLFNSNFKIHNEIIVELTLEA